MLTSKPRKSGDARVDAPHTLPVAAMARSKKTKPDSVSVEVSPAGFSGYLSEAATQKQADSLAARLQQRQQQLDHREALLNARQESLQQEARTERLRNEQQKLLLEEQTAELAEQAESLAQLAIEHERTVIEKRALQNREAAFDDRMQQWEETQAKFAAREAALNERETAVESRFDELRRRELKVQRSEETQRSHDNTRATLGQVTQLRERLHEAHNMLLNEVEAASQERERLTLLRDQLSDQIARSREQTQEANRQKESEYQSRCEALDARQKRLDRREDIIEQLKADVSRAHRETLEMRLIVEELWGRLARTTAPEELSQGYAKARKSLSDHFQITLDTIAQQTDQLRETGAILESKVNEFNNHRIAFQAWCEQRLQDIETQAARLIARENELIADRQRLYREEEEWRGEKLQLQARMHELLISESQRAA